VEMWAAGANCDNIAQAHPTWSTSDACKDERGWAVAVGVISTFFAAIQLLLGKCAPGVAGGLPEMIISIIIWLLWVCSVPSITMGEPFGDGSPANGFYCTWLCLVFSYLLMLECAPQVAGLIEKISGVMDSEKTALFIIGMASLIEMWHAAKICDDANSCEDINAWAVAAGCMSLILCMLFGLIPPLHQFIKFLAPVLCIWWFIGMLTLTMPNRDNIGPFVSTCNGFCGTWVACFASLALCALCWGGLEASEGGSADESGSADAGAEPSVEPGAAAPEPEDEGPAKV